MVGPVGLGDRGFGADGCRHERPPPNAFGTDAKIAGPRTRNGRFRRGKRGHVGNVRHLGGDAIGVARYAAACHSGPRFYLTVGPSDQTRTGFSIHVISHCPAARCPRDRRFRWPRRALLDEPQGHQLAARGHGAGAAARVCPACAQDCPRRDGVRHHCDLLRHPLVVHLRRVAVHLRGPGRPAGGQQLCVSGAAHHCLLCLPHGRALPPARGAAAGQRHELGHAEIAPHFRSRVAGRRGKCVHRADRAWKT